MAGSDDSLILGAQATLGTEGFAAGVRSVESLTSQMSKAIDKSGTMQMNTIANVAQAWMQVGQQVSAVGKAISGMGSSGIDMLEDWLTVSGGFQVKMDQLKVIAGATGAELETLRELAVRTGIETAFSPSEAAQAMFELKSAGLSTKETMEALAPVLDLVAASGKEIDLSQGAIIGTVAMNKFGLSTQQIPGFMDQIVRANQLTNFHFREMQGFMNSIGSSASSMTGSSVASFLAIGGAARNAGMSAAEAGNAVSAVARSMTFLQKTEGGLGPTKSKKGNKRKYALSNLGLSITDLKDAKGEWKDMVDIFGMVMKGTEGMTGPVREMNLATLFGASNAKSLAIAMDKMRETTDPTTGAIVKGVDALKSLREQLQLQADGTGLAKEAAASYLDTWEGIEVLWKGSIETMKIVIGDGILPIASAVSKWMLGWYNEALAVFQKSKLITYAFLAAVGAGSLLLLVVGGLVGGFGSLIVTVASLVLAWSALDAAVLALEIELFPLLLITLAITAAFVYMGIIIGAVAAGLAVFGFVLYKLWVYDFGGIATKVTWFLEGVSVAFESLLTFLAGGGISDEMKKALELHPSMLSFVKFIVGLNYRLWWLKTALTTQLQPGMAKLELTFSMLSGAVGHLVSAVADLFGFPDPSKALGGTDMWWQIGAAIGFVFDGIIWALSQVVYWIAWIVEKVADGVDLLEGVGSRVMAWAGSMYDAGASMWTNFAAGMEAGWAKVSAYITEKTTWIRGMLPGSEPDNPASPLRGLGLAGAAIFGNMAAGLALAAGPFAGILAASLGTAVAGVAAVSGIGNSPLGEAAAPSAVAAAASPTPHSITVTIGKLEFTAPNMDPARADEFAKLVADKIAVQLQNDVMSRMGA